MASVPEHLTIIDFIVSAGWLPQNCSVCTKSVEVVYQSDPPFCRRCFEVAPPEIQLRLRRVRDIRQLLGFGEDDAGPTVSRALQTLNGDPPPVAAHPLTEAHNPFMNVSLQPGYSYEMYCVHGQSRWSPEDLNTNAVLRGTFPRFLAIPAQTWAVDHHHARTFTIAKAFARVGEEPPELPLPQSEVLVIIGIAVIPDAHPHARYLISWRPVVPWSGYSTNDYRTERLTDAELVKLRNAGKQFTIMQTQKGAPAGPRISEERLIRRMRDIARELSKHPTAEEFRNRFYEDQGDSRSLDVKTLRETHKYYGWDSYPDLVNDVLGPKTKSG